MTGEHKKLTLKEILKRHKKNSQDKKLHEFLEKGGRDNAEEDFNAVLEKAGKPSKP